MTRAEWAKMILPRWGAPVTRRNKIVIASWIQAEGGTARANPLNCIWPMPGATLYNQVPGVKNYVSLEQGLEATARTLNYGADHHQYGFRPIRHHLRSNSPAAVTLEAVEDSQWGTGGLALRCLPGVRAHWDDYRNRPITL